MNTESGLGKPSCFLSGALYCCAGGKLPKQNPADMRREHKIQLQKLYTREVGLGAMITQETAIDACVTADRLDLV